MLGSPIENELDAQRVQERIHEPELPWPAAFAAGHGARVAPLAIGFSIMSSGKGGALARPALKPSQFFFGGLAGQDLISVS